MKCGLPSLNSIYRKVLVNENRPWSIYTPCAIRILHRVPTGKQQKRLKLLLLSWRLPLRESQAEWLCLTLWEQGSSLVCWPSWNDFRHSRHWHPGASSLLFLVTSKRGSDFTTCFGLQICLKDSEWKAPVLVGGGDGCARDHSAGSGSGSWSTACLHRDNPARPLQGDTAVLSTHGAGPASRREI